MVKKRKEQTLPFVTMYGASTNKKNLVLCWYCRRQQGITLNTKKGLYEMEFG